ncbi:MAG: o-succinylbenzoate synthase [Gemmatimonadetes bacterium]|nr:o-succinylbenzoate synthase [Gemmatimonadota bacterium]
MPCCSRGLNRATRPVSAPPFWISARFGIRRGVHITDIEVREIRLPLKEPFRISSGAVTERRILLVRIVDADGCTAWAECVAGEQPNYSADTVDTSWLALSQWFGPRLLGTQVDRATEVDALLAKGVHGHRMARATLEMAMWGLQAKRSGIPLSQLLGGTRADLEVGISIGIQDSPAALVERARAALASGYRRIKMKIEPGSDVEHVAAVRSALGPAAPLMVDANNAYSLDDTATLQRLDDFDLMMIEQPLDHEDIVRHAALQRVLRTPLCLDESITSLDRAHDMITLRAGRIVNIKPGRVGGLSAAIAIHDLCESHAIPVWCGGMLESGIGRAYNVALASLPNFSIAGDISPSARYWERDIVSPEWTMTDGMMSVPSAPGIGVSVDADRIDDLTVRTRMLHR